jgi:hypothetical protein
MPLAPKEAYDRITRGLTAWENLRPQKTFAGMSLDKFRELIAPSLAARATIARLENELIAAQNQRTDSDQVSLDALLLAVNAIKGDPTEGEDGELYEAMGYVRKSERKTGLHRNSKTTTPSA